MIKSLVRPRTLNWPAALAIAGERDDHAQRSQQFVLVRRRRESIPVLSISYDTVGIPAMDISFFIIDNRPVSPQLSPDASSPSAGPNRGRLRVLIADDDRDTVASLEALLHDEGHHTRAVYHGRDVVNAVGDFVPDVVLLDIGLPGMTGYDVARHLRERYGSAKPVLIAVTAWTKSTDKLMMAKYAGFDHHVSKPYEPRELLGLIAQVPT